MIKLTYTIQIDTGKTRRRRQGGAEKKLILRVSGTPNALHEFLTQMQRIPSDLSCRIGFLRGGHSSGVFIHSALTFPVNDKFSKSVNKTLAQLRVGLK